MKKIKITKQSYKIIAKYLVYVALFVLLANAKIDKYAPFGLGLFVALTYSRQNLLFVAFTYVLSNIAFSPTIETTVTVITPALIITGAYFIHSKLKYPINVTFINIYAFLSSLVILAFCEFDGYLGAIVAIILGQVFTYSATMVSYTVLIRGLKYKFNGDEIASLGVVLGVLSLALYSVDIYGFNLFFLVAPFVVLLAGYFTSGVTLSVAIIMGLGVTLKTGDIAYPAITALWGLAVCFFKRLSYAQAIALLLIDVLLGTYFTAYPTYDLLHVVAVSVGALAFILMPKKLRGYITSNLSASSGGIASKNMINRSRSEVSNKLSFISNVFYDMNHILSGSYKQEKNIEEKSKIIAKNIVNRVCYGCEKKCECIKITDELPSLFEKMTYSCLKRGKATILDIPPFIASRCDNNLVLSVIKEEMQSFQKKEDEDKNKNKVTKTLAEQMKGMSEIFGDIAGEINKNVRFDQNTEQRIIDELMLHNVVCSEAIVYEDKEKKEVTLVVREVDMGKKIIAKVVSKLLKKKMIVKMNSVKKVTGGCYMQLIQQPNYDVVFGETGQNRDNNFVSGDSALVKKISDDKVVVALSDGMGSGKRANEKSLTALSMIESFYEAGFNSEVILSMVNKLLALSSDEDYATLDICVLDLLTGRADFIKMGATDGIVKRKDNCEIVSSNGLPIGILDEIKINVESKTLSHGDMVVVVSDGITDVLGQETLYDLVQNSTTNNPQILADEITNLASQKGATDDATAVVVRLYGKVA